jgi:hypothetical protein
MSSTRTNQSINVDYELCELAIEHYRFILNISNNPDAYFKAERIPRTMLHWLLTDAKKIEQLACNNANEQAGK